MAQDKGYHTGLIFLDLSKAFDLVNHTILLRKCKQAGFGAALLGLLESFLTDRKQFVCYDESSSETLSLPRLGVPQGSILGPLLFTIFLNSLPTAIDDTQCSIHCYADDVTIWYSHRDPKVIEETLQFALARSVNWFSNNQLLLNKGKSKVMVVRPLRQTTPTDILLHVENGESMEVVSQFCLLGVTIDDQLCFKAPTSRLCSNLGWMISKIKRLRSALSFKETTTLIHAFVLSRIRYCLPVYYCAASDTDFKRVSVMYKRTLRILLRVKDPRYPSTALYENSRFPPVRTLASSALATLAHKIAHHIAPSYLNVFFDSGTAHRTTRQTDSNKLFVPFRFKTSTCQKRSISLALAHTWNHLPEVLRNETNPKRFENKLASLQSHTG